ncbi:hypothetical protein [Pseudarthrobacter sp. fls2-241-R2A-127]|uniref:hypothetical protein n=1 Tax=Pseudarthrobacter sp. fls2-241-R2A-127 TaxID=3040303 RepID=UPI00255314E0|nr:hypothetical protein [Pseudarthrobacter sp. fls2-241-R2A-127]
MCAAAGKPTTRPVGFQSRQHLRCGDGHAVRASAVEQFSAGWAWHRRGHHGAGSVDHVHDDGRHHGV